MPPLGTSCVDEEAVRVVGEWIEQMPRDPAGKRDVIPKARPAVRKPRPYPFDQEPPGKD